MPFHGPSPQRRSHRLPTEVYACTGYEFFFTICARQLGEPFRNNHLAKEVCDSLVWTANRYAWRLFGYCLMPDHLHFACSLTEAETKRVNAGGRGTVIEGLLDHVARFKSFTTSKAWAHGIEGQLWQKSSYDRVFDMQWKFEDVLRYVLENPVEARFGGAVGGLGVLADRRCVVRDQGRAESGISSFGLVQFGGTPRRAFPTVG